MTYGDLTREQMGTVRNLCIEEAARLGYGPAPESRYHDENKYLWPRRLKKLAAIANKMQDQIDVYEATTYLNSR